MIYMGEMELWPKKRRNSWAILGFEVAVLWAVQIEDAIERVSFDLLVSKFRSTLDWSVIKPTVGGMRML